RVMISGSASPIFFHSTKPQTVIRVSRMQASPPQTSGVFWIQLFFLRRTSRLIGIARLEGLSFSHYRILSYALKIRLPQPDRQVPLGTKVSSDSLQTEPASFESQGAPRLPC